MGWLQVVPGMVVGSDHMNTAIRQGVVPFANAAARDAAITAPVEGQHCWLLDLHQEQAYMSSSKWAPVGGVMPFVAVEHVATILTSGGSWQPLVLAADAGAIGGGGMATPTDTSFTLPSIYPPMRAAVNVAFTTVQATRSIAAFGDGTNARVFGTSVATSAPGGFSSAAGVWVLQPGVRYNPIASMGATTDVGYIKLSVHCLGPA